MAAQPPETPDWRTSLVAVVKASEERNHAGLTLKVEPEPPHRIAGTMLTRRPGPPEEPGPARLTEAGPGLKGGPAWCYSSSFVPQC